MRDESVKITSPEVARDAVIAAEADLHLAYLFASPRFLRIEDPPYEERYNVIEHRKQFD